MIMLRIAFGSVVGALAGFLTRPCCIVPAALSVAGVSSAGLAHAAISYRPVFLSVGAVMLAGSLWLAFRREGGWVMKALAASATIIGFVLSAMFTGVH